MVIKKICFILFVFFWVTFEPLFAAPETQKEIVKTTTFPAHGGAYLQFPRGRFQETLAPKIFRWKKIEKVDTYGLLIYKINSDKNKKRKLIARYDFSGNIESASWQHGDLPPGEYEWSLQSYSNSNVAPLYSDSAKFNVVAVRQLRSQSNLLGLQTGFSQGNYTSSNNIFEVALDTAPTLIGLKYQDGSEKRAWHTQLSYKNINLGSRVSSAFELQQSYLYKLNKRSLSFFDYFIGPSFRTLQTPIVSSSNGTDIDLENAWTLNPGVSFLTQYRYDLSTYIYGEIYLDMPAVGTKSPTLDLASLNYGGRAGALYTLLWPFGISGELQMRSNNLYFNENSTDYKVSSFETTFMAYLFYIL